MNVLNLVTTPRPFFMQQCKAVRGESVDVTTIEVPSPDSQKESRTVSNYVRFYGGLWREDLSEFDIIHANYGLTAPIALAQPSRPVILTLWGSDLMKAIPRLSNFCAKHFDEVILPSKTMAPFLSTNCTVIPFGIDTSLFNPQPQKQARERIGWKEDSNIVLFPYDTDRDVKRYDVAVKVVEELEIDAELRVISGEPHEMMSIYMNASDAVLVTSERESGPMVVKEAALCNVPIVSTNVGFASDVLSDVKHAFVCNSEKKLKERLEAVLKSDQRSDGYKFADQWGLDKMGNRLIKVYESVLEK